MVIISENHNKSIPELINVENLEEESQKHSECSRNKIELLDHLFSFLETDKDLNYVLVGYFSKFLNLLINKFPHKIIGYIYNERKDILERIIQNSDKKSLAEVAYKLLLVESYLSTSEKDNVNSFSIEKSNSSNAFDNLSSPLNLNLDSILATRRTMLVDLFKKLIINDDPEKISNLANLCIEIIENRNLLVIILTEKSILEHLTTTLALNLNEQTNDANFAMNYNYQEILNVLINIIRYTQVKNIKTLTDRNDGGDIVNSDNSGNNQQESLDNTVLAECVFQNLKGILKNFLPCKAYEANLDTETSPVISQSTGKNNKPFDKSTLHAFQLEGTFGNFYKPLTIKRVKLVEFVNYILNYFKNFRSALDKILIQSEYLKYLVTYFFQNEWNNLFQLNFQNFFEVYSSNIDNHPEVTIYLFDELKLLEILIAKGSTATKDSEAAFHFNSGRKINHGYFAVLIEICHKISLIELNNPNFKEKYSTLKWECFLKEKVNYWKELFDQRHPDSLSSQKAEEYNHIINVNAYRKEEPKKETSQEYSETESYPFQRNDLLYGEKYLFSDDEESKIIKTLENNHENILNQVLEATIQKFEEFSYDIPVKKINKTELYSIKQNIFEANKSREIKDILNAKKFENLSLFKIDLDKLKSSTMFKNENVSISTKSINFRNSTKDQLLTPITVFKNAIKSTKFENSPFYMYFKAFSEKLKFFKLLMDRQEVRNHVSELSLNLEKMKKIYISILEYESNKKIENFHPKEEIKTLMRMVIQYNNFKQFIY
jgi:hypothetical protein